MPTPLNISASRSGAILGMSQYSTPLQVWLQIMESRQPGFCEKHNYQIPEFEYNSAMKWGHAFESAIIELAENLPSGADIVHREKLFQKDYITCHIDGLYDYNNDKIILHEGKTTSAQYFYSAFGEPGTDRVPVEYQLQCQHQMICTGAEKVILSVLVFPKRVEEWEKEGWRINFDGCAYTIVHDEKMIVECPDNWAFPLAKMGYFHQYTIHVHSDLQKLMLEAYADFWNNHVLTGTPPEPMNYDDIRAICREPVGTIIASAKFLALKAEYDLIGKEISDTGTLAKRREQIKVELINYCRAAGFTEDDESRDKWIIRSQDGKKLASYGRDKNGNFIFR